MTRSYVALAACVLAACGTGVGPRDGGRTDAAVDVALDAPGVDAPQSDTPGDRPVMPGMILMPGPGWTGPTTEPGVVGSGTGADAKAIARWDVVPHQDFDGSFNLGVVAFHMNGIDRVEFSAANGPWLAMHDMTLNGQSNVWEYWVTLRASDVATDGPVEIRAIAYPTVGLPRLLPPRVLYANARHTLPDTGLVVHAAPTGSDTSGDGSTAHPYHSIQHAAEQLVAQHTHADGATIALAQGDYDAPSGDDFAPSRWLTVTSDAGADPATVRVRHQGRPHTSWLRFLNVTLAPDNGATTLFEGFVDVTPNLWYDHCAVVGVGRTMHDSALDHSYTTYITDSTWRDTSDGPGDDFVRNVRVSHILSDAFSGSPFVVNSSVDDIDRETTAAHPDVYQIYQPGVPMDNYILYGVRATRANAQGLFVGDVMGVVQNCAFVNVSISALGFSSQWFTSARHVLLWHVDISGQYFHWRAGVDTLAEFDVRGSYFEAMDIVDASEPVVTGGLVAAHNHYADPTAYRAISPGTDVTSGDPHFVNEMGGDLHPTAASALRNRITPPFVPGDIEGMSRAPSASVGAYQ